MSQNCPTCKKIAQHHCHTSCQANSAYQNLFYFQLALNLGLVNRQGVGLQRGVGRPAKVKSALDNNGQVRGDDFVCDHCGYASISAKGLSIHMGLGKCKRTVKENLANGVSANIGNGGSNGYESEDEEVSFSPRSGRNKNSFKKNSNNFF